MDPVLSDDLTRLPDLLAATQRYAVDVLAGIDERPAASAAEPGTAESLPEVGRGGLAALSAFTQRWAPGFSGSAGPRYLGFVTGGATPAGIAGDWLTSVFDQNPASGGDSIAPELEKETVRWLQELFGIGTRHEGTFVSGATMSNYVGIAIAREWLGEQRGVSVTRQGVAALGPIDVLSGSPHSSVYKALSMAGIGRDALRTVPTLPGREAVDVTRLAEALRALDGRAAIVVANAGTVNTVDFDDLRAIAELRQRYPFWLHVDGAFGAFAALSERHAHLVDGLALADSICVDLHKWLNVPYDSAVQFTTRRDLQIAVFHNAAAYLAAPTDDPAFADLKPENSHRLRSLAAWLSLAAYGRRGHQEIVTRDIAAAEELGRRIDACPDLRLVAPVRLNVVCFTLAERPTTERVRAFVDAVAASGDAFVTPTEYENTPAVRAAFSNWRTGKSDVDRAYQALARAAAL